MATNCQAVWLIEPPNASVPVAISHSEPFIMQPIEKQIINILSDRFTPADSVIAPSMNLRTDLGFDSLDLMELIVVLEAHFNISIPDQQAGQIRTVGDIIKLISDKSAYGSGNNV